MRLVISSASGHSKGSRHSARQNQNYTVSLYNSEERGGQGELDETQRNWRAGTLTRRTRSEKCGRSLRADMSGHCMAIRDPDHRRDARPDIRHPDRKSSERPGDRCARILSGFALAIVIGVCCYSTAFGQGTPEQRAACTPDVLRLCGNHIPDAGRITACLKQERFLLSKQCRNVLFPRPAAARERGRSLRQE